MYLRDLIARQPAPAPWQEGDNIPWHEPAFSARMLREHLSQAHDAASRRSEIIDAHVAWIHERLLGGRGSHILDLGCGPGLYSHRLAALGHVCTGIDYSPASITYAREQAERGALACTFVQADLRAASYVRDGGAGYDLVMLIFGELNVFRPVDATAILGKAFAALARGGKLLLEPHTYQAVRAMGDEAAVWTSAERGLFSDQPHLLLTENCWDETAHVATTRYFVVEAEDGATTRHAQSMQAYRAEEYRRLLVTCGFSGVTFYAGLGNRPALTQKGLLAIVANK